LQSHACTYIIRHIFKGETSSDSDATTCGNPWSENEQFSGLWVPCSFNESEDRDLFEYKIENYDHYWVQAVDMMMEYGSPSVNPMDYADQKFKRKKGRICTTTIQYQSRDIMHVCTSTAAFN
jgi:hypothetical protein